MISDGGTLSDFRRFLTMLDAPSSARKGRDLRTAPDRRTLDNVFEPPAFGHILRRGGTREQEITRDAVNGWSASLVDRGAVASAKADQEQVAKATLGSSGIPGPRKKRRTPNLRQCDEDS
jgi:hypothetical protein